jgi:hypothetical protein
MWSLPPPLSSQRQDWGAGRWRALRPCPPQHCRHCQQRRSAPAARVAGHPRDKDGRAPPTELPLGGGERGEGDVVGGQCRAPLPPLSNRHGRAAPLLSEQAPGHHIVVQRAPGLRDAVPPQRRCSYHLGQARLCRESCRVLRCCGTCPATQRWPRLRRRLNFRAVPRCPWVSPVSQPQTRCSTRPQCRLTPRRRQDRC